MPTGSYARTRAPDACNNGTITRLGLSRISSVFGLKVRPSTAIVLPATEPPHAAITFSAIRVLRASLTSTTASTIRIGVLLSRAVRTNARVSLGKHEPP